MSPVTPPVPFWRQRAFVARLVAAAIVVALLGVLVTYAVAGFFDRDGLRFQPGRPGAGVAVVYLSGDMGLRAGTAPYALRLLRINGVPVLAVSTPTLFRARRDAAFATRVLARAIVAARVRSGASRIVVIGQSYGADIAEVGLSRLTPADRARVAGALLIVPGRYVYFRADPTSLVYRFAPDADGGAAIARIAVPFTCVQGVRETDGACTFARQPGATRITLPGGHSLHGDRHRIDQLIGDTLRAAATRALS